MHGTLYRVLPGTHGGTPGYSRGTVHRRVQRCSDVWSWPCHAVSRSVRRPAAHRCCAEYLSWAGALCSTHGYSLGTDKVPTEYSRGTHTVTAHPATHANPFRVVIALGSARQCAAPGRRACDGTATVEYSQGTPRYFQSTHRVLTGTHMRSSGTVGPPVRSGPRAVRRHLGGAARLGPTGTIGVLNDFPSRRRGTDCACAAAPTTAVPTTAAPTWSPTTATPTVSGAHSPVPMR